MKGLAKSVIVSCLGIGFLLVTACSSLEDGAPMDTATGEVPIEATATGVAVVETDMSQPTVAPAPSPTPKLSATVEPSTALAEEPAFVELLSFVPTGYAATHIPVSFGPAIYLLDLDQIRADLGIGSINGASDYKEKLDLIIALGEASQGLPIYPETLFPISSSAFDEWGWDFADVNATLHLPDFGGTVLSGDFSRPEVIQKLEQNGERWPDPNISDFSIYTIRDGTTAVALKPDTLIVVKDEISAEPIYDKNDVIATLIVTDFMSVGIDRHPIVDGILSEVGTSWGIVMAPSPDIVEYNTILRESMSEAWIPGEITQSYEDIVESSFAALPWDIMAVGFTGSDDGTDLVFAYHYPEEDIAPSEMDIARTSLSVPSSFVWRGLQLQDILHLNTIIVNSDFLIVRATTEHKEFLGSTLEQRDYPLQLGLLLVREE